MDEFVVDSESVVLEESHLVNELRHDTESLDLFEVLIGKNITHFHEVSGGFDPEMEYHVVHLIHRVQGDGSPPSIKFARNVEVHGATRSFRMHVLSVDSMDSYPEHDYVLTLHVDTYSENEYTMSDIEPTTDKRPERREL